MKILALLSAASALVPLAATAQTWTPGAQKLTIAAAASELMTDGTVMVQAYDSGTWFKLTPDMNGSYVNGSWTQMASMPSGYTPLYFASAVLPDGRLIVNGGEYNGGGKGVWTTKGAIYDPVANAWTSVAPPAGWTTIGDAQSVVLPDGTYMIADCCSVKEATLNLTTMTWTATGSGKADINDEEGWTLLPGGSVLTVDANNTADLNHTEILTNGVWSSAGDTLLELADLQSDGSGSHELGAAVLRPNGTVFATGATGHNAVYTIKTKSWSAAPDFPVIGGKQYDVADGPATLEPSGNVLVAASPGVFGIPTAFYEFNGTTLTAVPAYAHASKISSFEAHLLLLPNGQIMCTDFSKTVQFYTPAGTRDAGSVPKIRGIARTMVHGQSYVLTGVGLNGQSQAGGYGDDFQNATNYPLVRITNTATGHVAYAKTSGFSSMGVAVTTPVTANVLIPAGIETGPSTLVAVANGIPSKPVKVTID